MKNEEIAQKLDKLMARYQKLKQLRSALGEDFNPEDEDLLSSAELMAEALKNYMYQFGMSIYRNKKGKRFFKKFIHDEDEVRGFDELDTHCFEFQENEAGFWQRLLEYKPEDRILMTKSIEDTVISLYQSDEQMIGIFDELVNEESERCQEAIKECEIDAKIEKTFDIKNEINQPAIEIDIDAPAIDISDIEKEIEVVASHRDNPRQPAKKVAPARKAKASNITYESYQCGSGNVDNRNKQPKPNFRPVGKEVKKDNRKENTNNR